MTHTVFVPVNNRFQECKVKNASSCPLCGSNVHRYEHIFECCECGAIKAVSDPTHGYILWLEQKLMEIQNLNIFKQKEKLLKIRTESKAGRKRL